MARPHKVSQPERCHIVHHGLTRAHHQAGDDISDFGRTAEGQLRPVARDGLGGRVRIPGHTSKGVPVRLVKNRPRPVSVAAYIRDPGHAGNLVVMRSAINDRGNRRALIRCVSLR